MTSLEALRYLNVVAPFEIVNITQTLDKLHTYDIAFADSVDQDQTAQNMKSNLGSTLPLLGMKLQQKIFEFTLSASYLLVLIVNFIYPRI